MLAWNHWIFEAKDWCIWTFVNLKPLDVYSDEPVHVNIGKHETTVFKYLQTGIHWIVFNEGLLHFINLSAWNHWMFMIDSLRCIIC